MQAVDARRPQRQDTYDLRDQLLSDDSAPMQAHAEAASRGFNNDEEQHSVMEDDSDGEEGEDYIEDDGSSELSIPGDHIDFDLVYSLHSFAATVEGQANVVKGDRLILIDDTNSYWWLVRVLKTQEVGYIPAENIETPFERLARLNRHRNVDLTAPTQLESQEALHLSQNLLRARSAGRSPSPTHRRARADSVHWTSATLVHRYPPAIWKEEEEEEDEDLEWDEGEYMGQDADLAEEERQRSEHGHGGMETDDDMQWDDAAVAEMQAQQMPTSPPGQFIQNARDAQQEQLTREQLLARQQEALIQQQQQQQQSSQWTPQQQQQQDPRSPRDRLNAIPDAIQASSNTRRLDPAEATETVRKTITPSVARDDDPAGRAYVASQKEDPQAKRIREEEEEAARKRAKGKDKSSAPAPSPKASSSKLRKEQPKSDEEEVKEKKKKSSMFSGIFGGRKKDKHKEKSANASITSFESNEAGIIRESEESNKSGRPSGSVEGFVSPTTNLAMQQQQQQQAITIRSSGESKQSPSSSERDPQVSVHASQLRQHDQHQQALYQQYLSRSPPSSVEAQPSYGLQSASAVLGHSYGPGSAGSASGLGPPAQRTRPGSLILTTNMDGSGSVPELSVIRVFAGTRLQTEATFKTVLLNSSTTSSDLVRQAIQRFRLPAGENPGDYCLTVKQIEGGSSIVLQDHENPLVVFDTLVNEAMELPKVKRSSVGSISSISSNLSMHPAIRKLSMNDFTDDSAVKFYLNKRGEGGVDSLDDGDDALFADATYAGEGSEMHSPPRSNYLTVSTYGITVTPERFSSPSIRFAVQLIIYPEDLPSDMVFHPHTEAIVFKDQLRESEVGATPMVNPHMRRKIFMFPKNVTVAEVIEMGLERFGILEGVVDGGDDVEDKAVKRHSSGRVRYTLWANVKGQERELPSASKVVDAYPRPPVYRSPERHTGSIKRRSVDSTQLLGTPDDVQGDDPTFILRRATSYRNSNSRHRNSVPLDEVALQHLHHRDSASHAQETNASPQSPQKQQSRQEIVMAQRAAMKADQQAILSAQSNSLRGMDLLLPDHALLRSSRYDSNDRMRYSYVEPDGETYDISDLVEAEWKDDEDANKNDLLEDAVNQKGLDGRLDRILSKIKSGKMKDRTSFDSRRESHASVPSVSEYSVDDSIVVENRSRSATPGSAGSASRISGSDPHPPSPTQNATAVSNPYPYKRSNSSTGAEERTSRPGTITPTGRPLPDYRRPSFASVMSDHTTSGYVTPPTHMHSLSESPKSVSSTPRSRRKGPVLPKDDFGISDMMAIIECNAALSKPQEPPAKFDIVDERLFGPPVDLESLHPSVRDIFADGFRKLEEMDKILNSYMQPSLGAS